MKIRVTTAFNDRQNGCVTRPVNEVFECSDKRARELISLGYAERVEDEQPKGKLAKTKSSKKAFVQLTSQMLFYCSKYGVNCYFTEWKVIIMQEHGIML